MQYIRLGVKLIQDMYIHVDDKQLINSMHTSIKMMFFLKEEDKAQLEWDVLLCQSIMK